MILFFNKQSPTAAVLASWWFASGAHTGATSVPDQPPHLSGQSTITHSLRWRRCVGLLVLLLAGLTTLSRGQCFQVSTVSDKSLTIPYSQATGDFNGDGRVDLVSSTFSSESVAVFLNNGNGGFEKPTYFPAAGLVLSVAVGDFNGDGRADLATVSGGQTVAIMLNNGLGGFGVPTTYTVGRLPRSVKVGDFNGDGRLDLATLNWESYNISVLLGNGLGGFGAPTNTSFDYASGTTINPTAGEFTVGDFNGDGRSDFSMTSYIYEKIAVMISNGAGGFGPATYYGVASPPRTIAVGDFNSDGKIDLATTGYRGIRGVSVLPGNGAGGFGNYIYSNLPEVFDEIKPGDFNGDGKLDLVVSNYTANTVSILPGSGTGTFGVPVNVGVGQGPVSVVAADFNKDGKPDLATGNRKSDNLSVLLNINCSPPNTPPTVATPVVPQSATAGQAFTYIIPAGTFADAQTPASLTLSVSGLPPGLTFRGPATIVGTPSGAGIYPVIITATDPAGLSVSTTFSLIIMAAPAPLVLTALARPITLLTTGTTTLSATVSGGTPPYSYTFSGPGVIAPAGNTALVSALPAGVQTFTVVARDAAVPTSQRLSTTVSVTVLQAPPTVANPVPPLLVTLGQDVSYLIPGNTFAGAQVPGGLVLSVSGLPAGLTFTGPRTISGKPLVSGIFTVTLTATNSSGLSVITTFTITAATPIIPLAKWDFTNKGGRSTVAATQKAAEVSTATTGLGTGLTAENYLDNGLTATGVTAANLADALAGNDYFSFRISPVTGKSLSVTKVDIRPVSQNVNRTFVLFSSADGFTAGKQLSSFTANANYGTSLQSMSISSVTSQTATIEFRVYAYGGESVYESVGAGNRNNPEADYDIAVFGRSVTVDTRPTFTLAKWDFTNKGGQSTVAASQKAAEVSTATTGLGTGLTAENYLDNGLTGITLTAIDLAGALAGNKYFSFRVVPNTGQSLSVTKVDITPVSQNVNRTFVLFSSVDGFAVGKQLGSFTSDANYGAPLQSIPIGSINGQTAAIEFRVYVYGGESVYESVGAGNRSNPETDYDIAVFGRAITVDTRPTLTLASWDFTGKGGQSTIAATRKAAEVSTATTGLGTGLTAENYLDNGLTGITLTAIDLAGALAGNKYFSFTLTPTVGKSLSITSVDITPVSQNLNRTFVLFSSVDGFAAGKQLGSFTAGANYAAPRQSLPISGINSQTATIEFRVYVYGGESVYESVGAGNRSNPETDYDIAVFGRAVTVGGGRLVATSLVSAEMSVQVYPNPVSSELTVSGLEVPSLVEVVRYDGRVVRYQDQVENQGSLLLSDLATGIYIVRVSNQQQGIKTFKIIKQ